MSVAAVIMAAGESSRLGQPKQMVVLDDKTLLRRAIDAALDAECSPVLVVVGAHAETIVAAHQKGGTEFILNREWGLGLGTSIRAGIRHVTEHPGQSEAVILMTCDQPRLTGDSLRRLLAARVATGKQIVASRYADTLGVPALFDRSVFDELLALGDDEGAKGIIIRHEKDVSEVALPEAEEDIDTPSQLVRLLGVQS